ncbi:MAG: hypothetical protein PHE73_02875 [Sulfurovaceae bacterium]|nr:hypothetical protein [Sulfurovaceae bacterium]
MNAVKIIGAILIVGGVLGLAFGSFDYTKDTQVIKMGPMEMNVKETKTVNIPVWASIGIIVLGGALLFLGSKKN